MFEVEELLKKKKVKYLMHEELDIEGDICFVTFKWVEDGIECCVYYDTELDEYVYAERNKGVRTITVHGLTEKTIKTYI